MDLETLYRPCFMPSSNWFVPESHSIEWTREDNKLFESALAIYDKDTPDRWYKVAAMIPGKTVYDVIKQYRELEEDVSEIEAGRVPFPGYLASSFTFELVHNHIYDGCKRKPVPVRGSDHERKKGVPWTEEEHRHDPMAKTADMLNITLVFNYRRFLMGLLKYGKGDWRNISRNFVLTKTPTQVASHAQKYYIRQKVSGGKDKRRPSIHDITTVNLTEEVASDKPQLFNVSSLIKPQQRLNCMSQPQLDWTSQYNDGLLMLFNSNSDDLFVSSSSDITSMALKMQGQDLYDCALHEAYAKVKVPGFSMAPRDFNNEAAFGIRAL